MFGKKRTTESEIESESSASNRAINPQTLMRWFAYDFGDGVPSITRMLGLTPVSEEGHTIELSESKRRTEQVNELAPLISVFATIIGPVMTMMTLGGLSHYKDENPDVELTNELTAEVCSKMNQQMLFYISVSLIAAAIELGALSPLGRIEYA